VIKEGMSLQEAVAEAKEKAKQVKEEGVDQAALDAAAARDLAMPRLNMMRMR